MEERTTMSKRYVIFIPTLSQGGAERVISLLSRKMAEDGLSVTILLYKDLEPFYTIDPKVKLVYVPRESGTTNLLKNLLWMRRYYRDNADAVLSFLAPFNILTLLATLGGKQTVIVADRNDPRFIPGQWPVRKLRDFLYRFADGVIVQTKHNQVYFSRKVQEKSTIIYNPVDLGEKAGLSLRTEKEKRIVSVGRLMPQKNQIMLLEAFAKVREQFPEYTLTIYGEGPFRNTLEENITRLGLEDCVSLPGSVKDVHDRIASAELFVMSSNYEGMPNALIEAMCLGLPVISTAVSGATDLIRHGENGLLVDCGDTEALTGAMMQLLADSEKWNAFGFEAVKLNDMLKIGDITQQWLDAVEHYSEK